VPLLCGCGTTTNELRSDPWETGDFYIESPYSDVYLTFVSKARQCFHGGTTALYFFATAHESVPGKSGVVEIVQEGLARRVLISADIASEGDGTKVTFYVNVGIGLLHKFRPTLIDWAQGTGNDCFD
jgi:hypothetical protein